MSVKTIYLAGGCFWGTHKFFDQFAGVLKTEVIRRFAAAAATRRPSASTMTRRR